MNKNIIFTKYLAKVFEYDNKLALTREYPTEAPVSILANDNMNNSQFFIS